MALCEPIIGKAITLTHQLSDALAQIVAFTNLGIIIKFGAQGPGPSCSKVTRPAIHTDCDVMFVSSYHATEGFREAEGEALRIFKVCIRWMDE